MSEIKVGMPITLYIRRFNFGGVVTRVDESGKYAWFKSIDLNKNLEHKGIYSADDVIWHSINYSHQDIFDTLEDPNNTLEERMTKSLDGKWYYDSVGTSVEFGRAFYHCYVHEDWRF